MHPASKLLLAFQRASADAGGAVADDATTGSTKPGPERGGGEMGGGDPLPEFGVELPFSCTSPPRWRTCPGSRAPSDTGQPLQRRHSRAAGAWARDIAHSLRRGEIWRSAITPHGGHGRFGPRKLLARMIGAPIDAF